MFAVMMLFGLAMFAVVAVVAVAMIGVTAKLLLLPFKLMLFVLADGWNLLLGSLAASFAT